MEPQMALVRAIAATVVVVAEAREARRGGVLVQVRVLVVLVVPLVPIGAAAAVVVVVVVVVVGVVVSVVVKDLLHTCVAFLETPAVGESRRQHQQQQQKCLFSQLSRSVGELNRRPR